MGSFYDFAAVCQSLGQTSSRLQIAELAGEFLARLPLEEAATAARLMVGQALEQGAEKRLQISGRAVWRIVAEMTGGEEQGEDIFAAATDFGEAIEMLLRTRTPEPDPTLTIAEVANRLGEMAEIEGRNSRGRKLAVLRELFERTSVLEGKYLAKILIGEMRHGMSDGLMLEAIARMAAKPISEIRRAHMLEGDLGRLVLKLRGSDHALSPTPEASSESPLEAQQSGAPQTAKPLKPMLAAPAANIAEAFRILEGNLALEHKLDGARVQIHRDAAGVRVFSRRLNEVTASLPEVVEIMTSLQVPIAIFDGEVIAIDEHGRPRAFQDVMRRFGRRRDIDRLRAEQPIRLFVFDLMGLDGRLLIDTPYEERYMMLAQIAETAGFTLAQRIIPASVHEAEQFYARAIAAGYEGVMAKALSSAYTPGARGRGWLKIKSARTLDLVIVAADWGYGRRHGWLSNYHLAARDEASGELVEVGKTFKGLTDSDFREMTERLLALKTEESHGTVQVRPKVVVEVAYSDIQRSPRYAGGMALRFARIVGIRSDKGPEEIDTIANIAAAFDRQIVKPTD
ncbi:MAG TPA: ATP-dependent DNA ligase [Candidatus Binataceae bacterium]|nr:ATP-dependent DNA ligase [Candidatus Binataceae bacterium]